MEAAWHEPLTTKEGWARFVAAVPAELSLLPARAWRLLGAQRRAVYDEARLDYHSRFITVATPAMLAVSHTGRRNILLNRHTASGRSGLVVSGGATYGKTTAITQLGRTHELAVRGHLPPGSDRLPVVYITVPPAATPRMIAVELARFLGITPSARRNITDVIDTVCAVLIDAHCDLVLVDEIHNIDLFSRHGADASDTLKYFSERIPATFVYAGVDLTRTGIFDGTRGRQIAGRFSLLTIDAFGYTSTTQRQQWQTLVASFENALRLHRHRNGTLAGLADYLHQRTAGSIGSLAHLIRAGAIAAVLDGSEHLTRTSLNGITLDHAAERAATRAAPLPPRSRARRAPRRPSSAPTAAKTSASRA
ncbi:AAA family ATPase [Kineococcus siccus]|uniref:AAA family ATPase n=1 Tax=Kineococcus siccus TaxID=2696567 RepID=UPI003B830CAB